MNECINEWPTYRPLAVEQRCAAARSNGPVAEVEHMVDLLSQLGCVLMLTHKPNAPLFVYALLKMEILLLLFEQIQWIKMLSAAS